MLKKQKVGLFFGVIFAIILLSASFLITPQKAFADRASMEDAIAACKAANLAVNGQSTNYGPCQNGYQTGVCNASIPKIYLDACNAGIKLWNDKNPTTTTTQQTPTTTLTQTPTNSNPGTASSNEMTCAIQKMGWILCPLIETAGKIGDQAFRFIANNFLQTEPELVSNKSGTKTAWELSRNIANLLFIAAFLIIILSQVTGQGINNYGIKKLLPKIIIAAIAVNVSYYICQLMVDLTNILGYEIKDFLTETAAGITSYAAFPAGVGNGSSDGFLGVLSTGVLGIATLIWFLLPMLFLGVSTVVITCLVIIAILLMRKAFIVLLVVISPIAFVAYLLPNTEKYFQKWLNMFWQLLLVFPVIGLLFGAGQLASAIVLVSGINSKGYSDGIVQTTEGQKCIQLPSVDKNGVQKSPAKVGTCTSSDGGKSASAPFTLGLVAAGIAVAPMLAVWAVLKGALSAAGAIGGKVAGAIQKGGDWGNKYARKPEDWARKSAFDAAKTGIATQALNRNVFPARVARRWQKRGERQKSALDAAKAGFDSAEGGAADISKEIMRNQAAANAAHGGLQKQYIDDINAERINIGDALGKNIGEEVAEAIEAQETRAQAEAVKEVKEATDTTDLNEVARKFSAALRDNDKVVARAMQDVLLTSGSRGQGLFRAAAGRVDANSDMGKSLRQNVLSNHDSAKSADAALKEWSERGGQPGQSSTLGEYWSGNQAWNKVDTVAKFAALGQDAQIQAARNMDAAQLQSIQRGFRQNTSARGNLNLELQRQWRL